VPELVFTLEARRYAARQLIMRSGAPADLLQNWELEVNDSETVLHLDPNTRVRFRHAPGTFWRDLLAGRYSVAHARWPIIPARQPSSSSDLVVPFVDHSYEGPLFIKTGERTWECPVDILASILLTLSRFEELLPGERDIHGRFLAAHSVAFLYKYLHRPIVDEYGLAFEEVIQCLLPNWKPSQRKLRVKLSHDIDEVGIPLDLSNTLGHTIKRRKPWATVRDLLSPALHIRPALLDSVLAIARLSEEKGVRSAFYWKCCARTGFDSGYDICNPAVLRIISELKERGVEQGVHPGYHTFDDPSQLRNEIEQLRQVLGQQAVGGRQHFLRWHPVMWLEWERLGLAYDSTVGFSDKVGFRSGTCIPYRPWSLILNREIALLEIPLVAMDVTLKYYMDLSEEQCTATLRQCIDACRKVGGVFTLLWHNRSLLDPNYGHTYQTILAELGSSPDFDFLESTPVAFR